MTATAAPAIDPAPPRRRDAAQTRARILSAARRVFATRDYTQARVSDVAAAAQVNQALVIRYFGSKEHLFETALNAVLDELPMQGGYEWQGLAQHIVAHLTCDDEDKPDPLPMVIHATSDPVAQAISQRVMEHRIIIPLAAWLGGADGVVRAAEILALCAGFFTYRHLLPMPPFIGTMDPGARSWLERSLEDILNGSARGRDQHVNQR